MRVAFVLLLRLVATARAATIELGSDGSTADPKVTFHETTHSNVRAEIESTANAPLALKTASTSGTSPAMRLMVTAAGLVGIGETSPQATLDVNSGATNVVARFKSTDGTAAVKLEDNSGNVELSTSNGGLAVQPAGGTAVVSVLANGRVGIGTNSPDQMLHLSSSSTSVHQYIESTSTSGEAALFLFGKNSAGTTRSGMFKFDQADNLRIGTSSAIDMRFETSDVVRMSIHRNGGLALGTAAAGGATNILEVTGAAQYGVSCFSRADVGASEATMAVNQQGLGVNKLIKFETDGVERGAIYADNNPSQVTYSTTSDYRLKTNVAPMMDGLSRLMALRPVRYTWVNSNTTSEGFIAHEVQAVYPHAVNGVKDGLDESGQPALQSVDYGRITPLLASGVQELVRQLDEQRRLIERLSARLDGFEREGRGRA